MQPSKSVLGEYVVPTIEEYIIYLVANVFNITKIESIQRRFAKRIPYASHLSYSDRDEILGLESLEHIRLIAYLTMMYSAYLQFGRNFFVYVASMFGISYQSFVTYLCFYT